MELFKLFGTVAVSSAGAVDSLEEISQKGEHTESRMSKAFTKIGSAAAVCGKAIATGLAVGASAMAALTMSALNAGGELEQNMGGSVAVFADHAEEIQDIAKEAYANMGLSASEYLATANKMGALFKGAGFEIKDASDLASQAMQRAADVASIMGISTESAMESIAGAAKGNFTMMDNLGVAMNETTLEAYALAKGIEKSYKEFSNQEKIGLAMEMFLEKTSYAAGNYAKENETLAGSLGTAKAALQNFVSGAGDVDAVVESIGNAANVVVKNLNDVFPRLVAGVTGLIRQLVPMIPPLLQSLLPGIIEGAVELINGLVKALPTIVSALMDALPDLIKGVEQIFISLVSALPSIMQTLMTALPTLIPMLINSVASMILVLMQYLPQIVQPIIDNLPEIIIAIINALLQNLPLLIEGCIQLVIGIVAATPQIILALVKAIPMIITSILEALWNVLPVLIEGIVKMTAETGIAIWELLSGFFITLGEWFSELWESIKYICEPAVEWFSNFFAVIWGKIVSVFSVLSEWVYINIIEPVSSFFIGLWQGIVSAYHAVIDPWIEIFKIISDKVYEKVIKPVKEFFINLWNNIVDIFSKVSSWFNVHIAEPVKNVFSKIWSTMKDGAVKAWNGIKEVFGKVADWFKNIFSKAWTAVKNVFSKGGKVFSGLKDGIADVFKTVVNTLIKGINKVIKVPFNAINKMLNQIRSTSIVGVKPFEWIKKDLLTVPEIPQLEKGGVLKKGQVGFLEGNGAEAVVPLEKNTGWLDKIAERLNRASEPADNKDIIDKLDELIRFIKELRIYLYGDVLVGELAPAMDAKLGTIYAGKERGR